MSVNNLKSKSHKQVYSKSVIYFTNWKKENA